tara:strand:+ start:5926 stop:6978 length:1053 start_codon:yes stop_codon:yes gene_type:complete
MAQDFFPAIFSKAAQVIKAKTAMMGQKTEQDVKIAQMKYNNHLGRLKVLMEAQQAKAEMENQKQRLKLAEKGLALQEEQNVWTRKFQQQKFNQAQENWQQQMQRNQDQHNLQQTLLEQKEAQDKLEQEKRYHLTLQGLEQGANQFDQEMDFKLKKLSHEMNQPPTGQKPQSWQVGGFVQEWDNFLEQGSDLLALKGKWPGGKKGATFRNIDEGLHSDEDVFDWIRELHSKVMQTRQFPDPYLSFKVQGQLRKLKTDGDLLDRIKAMEDGSIPQTASAAIYDQIMGAFSLAPIRGQGSKETVRPHLEAARKIEQDAKKSKPFWDETKKGVGGVINPPVAPILPNYPRPFSP